MAERQFHDRHFPVRPNLEQLKHQAKDLLRAIQQGDPHAIADLRKLMGATNPANAEEGTIRKKWASSIEHNAIHGSDAEDTASFELSFFFAGYELAQ